MVLEAQKPLINGTGAWKLFTWKKPKSAIVSYFKMSRTFLAQNIIYGWYFGWFNVEMNQNILDPLYYKWPHNIFCVIFHSWVVVNYEWPLRETLFFLHPTYFYLLWTMSIAHLNFFWMSGRRQGILEMILMILVSALELSVQCKFILIISSK